MLSVLTTLFLSNSVDYGQLKTGRREESVIFSMQTFVVKAASGVAEGTSAHQGAPAQQLIHCRHPRPGAGGRSPPPVGR